MNGRFACLYFAESKDQIPIKYKILNKAPELFREWYIDRFNPFGVDSMEILEEEGLSVYLPLTFPEAALNEERTARLTERTLEALREHRVDILLPPKDYPFAFPEKIPLANGKGIFPFLILESIEKALKIFRKDLKTADILILAGDPELTRALLYHIYPHVNFLNLAAEPGEIETYRAWADYIFSDTGLNMGVFEKNKALAEQADIVLNTCTPGLGFDYSYKRGAAYFDLGSDQASLYELAGKRDDMLFVDGLRLAFNETSLFLHQAEAVFYVKSKTYRALLSRGFRPERAERAAREFKDLAPVLSAFCLKGQILNNLHFAKLLSRTGIG